MSAAHRSATDGKRLRPGQSIGDAPNTGTWVARPLRAFCLLGLVVSWSAQPLCVFDPTSTEGDGPEKHIQASPGGPLGGGQALKDRPTVQIASANVTSLQGVWDLITELPLDLLAMQELHITDLPHWQRRANQADMQLVVPDAAPGSTHLVGFLVRKGTLNTIPLAAPLAGNRVHLAAWTSMRARRC